MPSGVAARIEAAASVASWGAITAGAVVAVAVSLVLLALGAGLGFSGVGAASFTVAAGVWLIVTQWVASGFGGYVAGRVRTRWMGTHPHEVFFRDTAQGFVTWAVASVIVAALVASSVIGGVGSAVRAVSSITAGVVTAESYGIDKLFRSTAPAVGDPGAADPRIEAGRILANAVAAGHMPDTDRSYLAALVAVRAGITAGDAQRRVDDLFSNAMETAQTVKAEADAARRAAAQAGIYSALSLVVGAFIACVAAALGGRQRDEHA